MTRNGFAHDDSKPLASPAPPPPKGGQAPVPGGLIGRAGVNVTGTVYRCGASSDGSGWLMVFIIFLLIVIMGKV